MARRWLVFSSQVCERKEVTKGLQDDSGERITLLACISADETKTGLAIPYQSKGELQNEWVEDKELQNEGDNFC